MVAISATMILPAFASGGMYESGAITIAAGETSGEKFVDLGEASNYIKDLNRVVAYHVDGNATGTVSFVAWDIGLEDTIVSSGPLTNRAAFRANPMYNYYLTNSVNVVTGGVVVVVNDVEMKAKPYSVRLMKVKVAQPSSESSNTYRFSIFAD